MSNLINTIIGKTITGVKSSIYPREDNSYRYFTLHFSDDTSMYFHSDDDIQPYDPFTTVSWEVVDETHL